LEICSRTDTDKHTGSSHYSATRTGAEQRAATSPLDDLIVEACQRVIDNEDVVVGGGERDQCDAGGLRRLPGRTRRARPTQLDTAAHHGRQRARPTVETPAEGARPVRHGPVAPLPVPVLRRRASELVGCDSSRRYDTLHSFIHSFVFVY